MLIEPSPPKRLVGVTMLRKKEDEKRLYHERELMPPLREKDRLR
jgi:hypothetical protein